MGVGKHARNSPQRPVFAVVVSVGPTQGCGVLSCVLFRSSETAHEGDGTATGRLSDNPYGSMQTITLPSTRTFVLIGCGCFDWAPLFLFLVPRMHMCARVCVCVYPLRCGRCDGASPLFERWGDVSLSAHEPLFLLPAVVRDYCPTSACPLGVCRSRGAWCCRKGAAGRHSVASPRR